jgi:hypothetical protein
MPKQLKTKTAQPEQSKVPVPASPEATPPAAPFDYDAQRYAGDGYSSTPSADALIRNPGGLTKCTDGAWTDPAGAALAKDREWVAAQIVAFHRAFLAEGQPPEFYTRHPLPDIKALNDAIPREQWRNGMNGQPEPYWHFMKGVVLLDEKTGKTLLWANRTAGAFRAISELQEQVAMRRCTTGANEVPVVRLSSAPWPTQYGMKIRPAFELTGEWREYSTNALPPAAPQITAQPTTPADDPIDPIDPDEGTQGLKSTTRPKDTAW